MSTPVHRDIVYFTQFCDASGMVGMAVGAEDGIELQVMGIKKCLHRRSICRVDNRGMTVVVNSPYIVILKCGDCGNAGH